MEQGLVLDEYAIRDPDDRIHPHLKPLRRW